MKQKLLFVVNADWFFYSHRLNLAYKAIEEGYEVHLLTNVSQPSSVHKSNITIHHFPFTRLGVNIFKELHLLPKLFFVLKKIKPDIVHLVTLKPIVYVGVISLITPIKSIVVAISGMGFLYASKQNFLFSLLSKFLLFVIRLIIDKNNAKVIFQNNFDKNLISAGRKSILKKSILLKGVGVRVATKKYQEEKISKEISILMASRLLIDKGVFEFLEAAKIISKQRKDIKFIIAGEPDLGNPNSLSKSQYDEIREQKFLESTGFVEDMGVLFSKANILVLPSYREGFPKVLMEAASFSKPTITTNVPGCNEAVEHNVTGIIIPPKDHNALVEAIIFLADHNEVRKEMGKKAFKKAKEEFDENTLINRQLVLYKELIC
jgi:glycosyltransferase involved in cell wall biosynthesis